MRVIGVDAWRGGWVAVVLEDGQVSDVRLAVTLDQITDECPDAAAAGVDMPLGLVERGWREAGRLQQAGVGSAGEAAARERALRLERADGQACAAGPGGHRPARQPGRCREHP